MIIEIPCGCSIRVSRSWWESDWTEYGVRTSVDMNSYCDKHDSMLNEEAIRGVEASNKARYETAKRTLGWKDGL